MDGILNKGMILMLNLLKLISGLWLWKTIIILVLKKYTLKYLRMTSHDICNLLTNVQKKYFVCLHICIRIEESTNEKANGVKCSQQVNLGKEYLLFFENILVAVFLEL